MGVTLAWRVGRVAVSLRGRRTRRVPPARPYGVGGESQVGSRDCDGTGFGGGSEGSGARGRSGSVSPVTVNAWPFPRARGRSVAAPTPPTPLAPRRWGLVRARARVRVEIGGRPAGTGPLAYRLSTPSVRAVTASPPRTGARRRDPRLAEGRGGRARPCRASLQSRRGGRGGKWGWSRLTSAASFRHSPRVGTRNRKGGVRGERRVEKGPSALR